ncbi:transposase [Neobacillus citreus]|uniref:Transposase n=1 Tax=Neobacillus citreus TaxID=2833578 RepID=A0A942T435_9BACI|nr:transposase [Neobacillus citreus]MCH6265388.1 transposase [Neobacillus citreus]
MKLLFIIGSIVLPILMVILQKKWSKIKVIFDLMAILSALIFGNISSIAIFEIIKNDKVFMTNIHAVFLNPFFLMTGAYLGLYFLYILVLQVVNEIKTDKIL